MQQLYRLLLARRQACLLACAKLVRNVHFPAPCPDGVYSYGMSQDRLKHHACGQGKCLTGKRILLARHRPERGAAKPRPRSEEHTSELQSLMRISYAVFC